MKPSQDRLEQLIFLYRELLAAHPQGARAIALSEVPETVYNSNAIENSTLTLEDTENILLRDQIRKDASVREVYEAKNLARVMELLANAPHQRLTTELILSLHKILLTGINDGFAGRFRTGHEWVRVGAHVGASPALAGRLIEELTRQYHSEDDRDFLAKIAHYHAEFETIHPFCDGNGRIGRVLINQQLLALDLPPIIVRAKNKHDDYYPLFSDYLRKNSASGFENLFGLLLTEALHKYIAILSGQEYIPLSDWAANRGIVKGTMNNKAHRQTIPAFRIGDKWYIAADFEDTPGVELV